jgi:hypothetical protein
MLQFIGPNFRPTSYQTQLPLDTQSPFQLIQNTSIKHMLTLTIKIMLVNHRPKILIIKNVILLSRHQLQTIILTRLSLNPFLNLLFLLTLGLQNHFLSLKPNLIQSLIFLKKPFWVDPMGGQNCLNAASTQKTSQGIGQPGRKNSLGHHETIQGKEHPDGFFITHESNASLQHRNYL